MSHIMMSFECAWKYRDPNFRSLSCFSGPFPGKFWCPTSCEQHTNLIHFRCPIHTKASSGFAAVFKPCIDVHIGRGLRTVVHKFTIAMYEKLVSTRFLLFVYFSCVRLESCRIFSRLRHGTPCHISPHYEVSKVSSMGILSGVSTSHAFKLNWKHPDKSTVRRSHETFSSYKSSSLHR